jgi:hypothetical protein
MPLPNKKRVGIAGYKSALPQTPTTKRKKSLADMALLKRSLSKLPAAKRSKRTEQSNASV